MQARGVFAFLLALALLLAAPLQAAEPLPSAVAGRLALPAIPDKPLPLLGQWGFAWQDFVDPEWQQLPTSAVAPVPSNWNQLAADGKPPGAEGWGSYFLQVDCPTGQSLAVEALHQRTASRLYINGALVAQHGDPAPGKAGTWAAVHNRVPITGEFACPLRLTLHVANYDHRAGGFVRPITAGSREALVQKRETQVIQAAALLATYLLVGVVALIFYVVRHREKVPLVFGLFCLSMAIYTDMIGERLFLRPFPPQVDWGAYMHVEYFSWGAAMALFMVTLGGLFPQEIRRRVVHVVVGMLGLAGLAVAVLPPAIYSYVALPGQAIAVVVALYVASAMLRARHRTPVDARVMLAGMLAVVVTLGLDLLLIDAPRADTKFAPIGFALFMLAPAVVIARRLSQALNAEERSRTLEENARLREDMERVARHDLKTPLNSIQAAARLLHDDPRLAPDQRELVDVLQHAGRRMLEMVNLSLGLFKMEMDSYDLRPQPVNLREVVTRVLVDLHSHAQAAGVTLHLQGSAHAAVYVRGEEPLCYSIVANLVKNAIEASDPGEQVAITLRAGTPVALSVHNPAMVPPGIIDRFFDKYVTAKSGGTGLGTYSARLMARAQNGELQLRTDPDAGTTLTLTLPPSDPPRAQPVAQAADALQRAIGRMPARDVLVVDDDEFIRLVTRRLLPQPPFRVETASNGLAAMEVISRNWPHFVLIDMEMPHRNGLETVRWLRELEAALGRPRVHVIMLSGNDDEATPGRALAAGADRFIPKPADRERLLSTMVELELSESAADPHAGQAEAVVPALAPAVSRAQDDDAAREAEQILVVDPEWAEAFPGFLRNYRDSVEGMARALAEEDREDLQFVAHRVSGGLSAMGLHWAARQARAIEHDAASSGRAALDARIAALREHLARVRIEAA